MLSLLASFGLVLAPFGMLHAHLDLDHEQVLVHGGHSHDFDPHETHAVHDIEHDAAVAADYDAAHEMGSLHPIHPGHIVQLHSGLDDLPMQSSAAKPIKFITTGPDLRTPDPPKTLLIPPLPSNDSPLAVRNAYLHPPLRGPPAALPTR